MIETLLEYIYVTLWRHFGNVISNCFQVQTTLDLGIYSLVRVQGNELHRHTIILYIVWFPTMSFVSPRTLELTSAYIRMATFKDY